MAPFLQFSKDVHAALRHQQRTALLGAALVAPFALLDAAHEVEPWRIAVALATRLAWTVALLCGAALLSGDRPYPRAASALMSAGTVGASLVLVAVTGGPESGYFGFLLALPLCMTVLLPGQLPEAVAAGALGIAGGALLLVRAGANPVDVLRYAGTGVASSLLALYATHLGGVLLRRELEGAHARAQAADALATSERRSAASERLALVGRLAAGVAHEINNPLGFVKANLEYVRTQLSGPRPANRSELDAALADSDLGVERIRRIVADLRGFARDDADEPCGAELGEALAEALRLASVRTRGAVVRTALAPDVPRVRICRRRLVQVLVNLVVNAADAVQAGDDDRRWIEVAARAEDGEIVLRVEDGGPGIPDEILPRLFEPFFTTKPPGAGTGLGLALSRDYVVAAGGRLSAANGARGGAVFEVRLPPQSAPPGCDACKRVVDLPAAPRAPRAAAG